MEKISLKIIRDFIREHNYLNYAFIFLISFGLFFFLQSSLTFADPDSFYHARMAVLVKDQGIVKDFPWTQFSVLKNYYADHHYLYHVLLVPFVAWLDPLVGLKLATITLGALLITFIYWFLRKFDVKWAIVWPFLLLTSNPFMFRIGLAKAQALSLIILIFGLYFIFHKKYFWLFILSFFYVWAYGGWPIMFILALCYAIASALHNRAPYVPGEKNKNLKLKMQNTNIKIFKYFYAIYFYTIYSILYTWFIVKQIIRGLNIKLLASCLGGLITGLVINPYFPKNIYFYYEQIIKIAIINYQSAIGVGAEWYPYRITDLLAAVSLVWVFLIIAIVLLLVKIKKQSIYTWTLLLLSVFFLVLTLKSRRNVEYFVPFTVLFLAFSITDSLKNIDLKSEWQKLFEYLKSKKWRIILGSVVAIYFVITVPAIILRDLNGVKNNNRNGLPFNKFEKASQWLLINAPSGDIVFHNDWDEFPELFYHNPNNYYIVGLDPTFMYNYDKKLYNEWVGISRGDDKINLYQKIKNDFRADYNIIDLKRHSNTNDNLRTDKRFKLVYQDEEIIIYRVK